MRAIAVINQKGGVAKTTTTANLGHALALRGHKVTLIDLDPQGHLATYLGLNEPVPGMDDVFLDGRSVQDVAMLSRQNLTLVPAGPRLDALEQLTEGRLTMSKRLRSAIGEDLADQDFVLLDCPPSSGLLVIFALYSVSEALVPVNGDYLSLHGVSHFVGTLRNVEKAIGRNIDMRLAVTRVHHRRRLARETIDKLLHYFPDRVLATTVREAAVLAECPSFGMTIFEYGPSSTSAEEYESLAEDLEKGRTM